MKKLNFKYIFFDLDGTLTASADGIVKSYQAAIKKVTGKEYDLNSLMSCIGPPTEDNFKRLGFNEDEISECVKVYREIYLKDGVYQSDPFDGIEDVLKYLKEQNKILCVATSKLEYVAKLTLDHYDISKYFDFVAGGDVTRNEKSLVIEYIIEKLNIKDKNEIIMIGDTKYDIIGAKKAGVPSMGVMYGYGDNEELISCNADYYINEVEDYKKVF